MIRHADLTPRLPHPNRCWNRPAGGKTCFKHVFSLSLEEAMSRNKAVFPAEFAEGVFCEEYESRCDACARTWMRPHAMENLL